MKLRGNSGREGQGGIKEEGLRSGFDQNILYVSMKLSNNFKKKV